jgi:hypothetical protein
VFELSNDDDDDDGYGDGGMVDPFQFGYSSQFTSYGMDLSQHSLVMRSQISLSFELYLLRTSLVFFLQKCGLLAVAL